MRASRFCVARAHDRTSVGTIGSTDHDGAPDVEKWKTCLDSFVLLSVLDEVLLLARAAV